MDARNDLYIEGDVEVGGDLSLGGDVSISGVIFSDDYTEIVGDLTVGDDFDIRGRIYDGAGIDVDIYDNLSVSGSATIDGVLYVANNTTANDSDGLLDLGRNSAAWEYLQWNDTQARFILSDDLELEESGISRIVMDDASGQGELYYDDENYGFHMTSNLSIDNALTVMGNYISSAADLTINPAIGSGAVLSLGEIGEGDTVLINGSTTVSGYLTVHGDLTVSGTLYGQSALLGTVEDTFTIDTDDSTDTPALMFMDSNGNEYLRWNDEVDLTGAADGIDSFELTDDLIIAGDLTVEKRLIVEANGGTSYFSGASHTVEISDGHLEIYDSATNFTPTNGFADDGDLAVQNDVEIGGDLSIGGDVTIAGVIFSDDHTEIIGSLTVGDDIDVRGNIFDGAAAEVDILDNLSVSGVLNIDGTGENDIEGYINLGTQTTANNQGDFALSGELTVGGNRITMGSGSYISDDDANYTEISPQNNHLVVRDGTDDQFFLVYDSSGNQYVSLDMSQDPHGRLLVSNGDLFIQTNNDQDQYIYFTMAGNEPYLGTNGSAALGIDTDGDEVYLADGETLYVDTDTLYVDAIDDRVGIGTLAETHTLEVIGTARTSDDLTVSGGDLDLGSGSGVIHFDNNAEQFSWDTALDEFALTDDLSVAGDLTVWGNTRLGDNTADTFMLRSSGLNVDLDGSVSDNDSMVRLNDDVSVTGELSVGDDLIVFGSGLSRFRNGRVYVGTDTPTAIAQQSGDMYVQNDMEIGGDLSVNGDVTIGGVIFSSDFLYFGSNLTVMEDLDVRGRILDGLAPELDIFDDVSVSGDLTVWGRDIYVGGTDEDGWIRFSNDSEQLFWDESDNEFEMTDDLNILGVLTTTGGAVIGDTNADRFTVTSSGLNIAEDGTLSDFGGPVEVGDSLSISGDLSIDDGSIFGNQTEINMGSVQSGIVQVTGDFMVSNDVTIGGNLSVAGNILGADNIYVNTTGDTMTGTLNINVGGPGNTGLDVDGDIEYTGTLKNQSPVKIADGLHITNLGGIKGGQILLKDVIIALTKDMTLKEKQNERVLVVPKIKYLRFTEKRPVVHERTNELIVNMKSGVCELAIAENEHIIDILNVVAVDAKEYFVRNVGLDGTIESKGDYQVRGQRRILFWQGDDRNCAAVFTYKVREDINEPGLTELTIDAQQRVIEPGLQLVYIKEEPLNEISAHDTAAMSPETKLVLGVEPANTFTHSADTYVIAVVMPNNKINQYVRVNKPKVKK